MCYFWSQPSGPWFEVALLDFVALMSVQVLGFLIPVLPPRWATRGSGFRDVGFERYGARTVPGGKFKRGVRCRARGHYGCQGVAMSKDRVFLSCDFDKYLKNGGNYLENPEKTPLAFHGSRGLR